MKMSVSLKLNEASPNMASNREAVSSRDCRCGS
jgi:hypothetical protein